jgi:hypothetical protein
MRTVDDFVATARPPRTKTSVTRPTWPTFLPGSFDGYTTMQPTRGSASCVKNPVGAFASCTIASVLIHPPLNF